jgi:formylglycine-generating enzyme required for sulfatase activity/energy-coupling factor transporter ATP-binding protein EcfA2
VEAWKQGNDDADPVRVFVSSPDDVAAERQAALTAIRRVQSWFQGRFVLLPILWEQEPLLATAGFQREIDRRAPPAAADVAVFILWSRLGTPLSAEFALEDGRRPTGTEWEFANALRASRGARGLPQILVYRKNSPPLVSAALGREAVDVRLDQIASVERFFKRRFHRRTDLSFKGSFHRFQETPEFARSFEEHLTRLLNDRLRNAPPVLIRESPFRGLEAFQREHARVFFGRTEATHRALDCLRAQASAGRAFLLLLGASGSGKSSLLRAGLLPLLTYPGVVEEGHAGGVCRQAVMCPSDAGSDPFRALGRALLTDDALPELRGHGTADELSRVLAEDGTTGVELVRDALAKAARNEVARCGIRGQGPARLVLAVDQLEELFTTSSTHGRDRRSFALLLEALATSGVVWVIGTLRSDFYAEFAAIPALSALKAGRGQMDVGPPGTAELRQIIRMPAHLTGLVFEKDPTGRMLDEVLLEHAVRSPEALPLLEFALTLLYERRDGHRLTFATYDGFGGLDGAIGAHADLTWAAASAAERDSFPAVLRTLVDVTPDSETKATRRRAAWSEAATTPAREAFLDRLVRSRLLVAEGSDGARTVKVAHEALFRTWSQMRERIRAEGGLLRTRTRVRAAAEEWIASGRPAGKLDSEDRLAASVELLRHGFDLTDPESEFVKASIARAKRLSLIRRIAVVMVAASAAVAGWMAIQASKARDRAVADATRQSDLNDVRGLQRAVENLFPIDELSLAEAERLQEAARRAVAALPARQAELESLRLRASPDATGEQEFADSTDAATYRVLTDLIKDATRIAEPERGDLAVLRRRFEAAWPPNEDALWARTIAEIGDRAVNPDYGGLLLTRQWGLHPLGRDPKSRLHEFAYAYSGSLPERRDGQLVQTPDAAIVFVLIPGRRFHMGAQKSGDHNVDPLAREEEDSPVHEVDVPSFFISKFECTQAQWERLTGGRAPSCFHGETAAETSRLPVEQVSWNECDGSSGWLVRYGLRLPSEAEWEMACRAGNEGTWCFGTDAALLKSHAWHYGNSNSRTPPDEERTTHEVGSLLPNDWGLFDVHGNVAEWCEDTWQETYTADAPTDGSAWVVLKRNTTFRMHRGGSWQSTPEEARSGSHRDRTFPDHRVYVLGFRPARSLVR